MIFLREDLYPGGKWPKTIIIINLNQLLIQLFLALCHKELENRAVFGIFYWIHNKKSHTQFPNTALNCKSPGWNNTIPFGSDVGRSRWLHVFAIWFRLLRKTHTSAVFIPHSFFPVVHFVVRVCVYSFLCVHVRYRNSDSIGVCVCFSGTTR